MRHGHTLAIIREDRPSASERTKHSNDPTFITDCQAFRLTVREFALAISPSPQVQPTSLASTDLPH